MEEVSKIHRITCLGGGVDHVEKFGVRDGHPLKFAIFACQYPLVNKEREAIFTLDRDRQTRQEIRTERKYNFFQ